jgi:hypothetical protein
MVISRFSLSTVSKNGGNYQFLLGLLLFQYQQKPIMDGFGLMKPSFNIIKVIYSPESGRFETNLS